MTWGISIDETHDPTLRSWVESANSPDTPFPIQNLPLGIMRDRSGSEQWRAGVAVGDAVLDLARCHELGLFDGLAEAAAAHCRSDSLNGLLDLGPECWSALRLGISRLLREGSQAARHAADIVRPLAEVELGMPVRVGDYTDFFASIHHARRSGRVVRGSDDVNLNYRHLPVAYHGRASSVVISGTPVRRPWGQRLPAGAKEPVFGPSERVDFELEMAAIVGGGNPLGEPIPIADAHRYLFGVTLLNDWSARDLQAFEAAPLGPFLAKSFATTISPWIVTMGALAPFRTALEARAPTDPAPLPHLVQPDPDKAGINLSLSAYLQTPLRATKGAAPIKLVDTHFRYLYWSFDQMVAHHTSNGCNLRSGDLLGTGTVSGPSDHEAACLLEISEGGRRPLMLDDESRVFLQDHDEIRFEGWCRAEGFRSIGLGPCSGVLMPALPAAFERTND